MSYNLALKRIQSDLPTTSSGPLRHDSTASTNSSAYSTYSNSFVPSRTSTLTSNSSSTYRPGTPEHKIDRGSRVLNGYREFDGRTSPAESYESVRRSLRPLPQAPNGTPPKSKNSSPYHARSQTVIDPGFKHDTGLDIQPKYSTYRNEENKVPQNENHAFEQQIVANRRANHTRTRSSPNPPALAATLTAPELQTLERSSTRHLRTLSKFAQSESEDFAITNLVPSVVGLQGRRQLRRADSVRGDKGTNFKRSNTTPWPQRDWMDQQRQFLQAYEYLCHIGEAKEWIEDVIHKPIPPIVQLEEALRDGITLAEVVQALYPHRIFRIFRHPKLQFRHSDNIALFFQFLDELGLPEVFRFELIDLYEKKNIPKVIHCIHALSWLLFKKGVVDFRIGNLVGQLEFEHHELEQTQRGLDKAGVPMPSFSGMGESFGAEPEPEPVETEEERIARELREHETSILDFQTQVKGAILRLRLGNLMQHLWDNEEMLIDLQSRIRGDWARQIVNYRLNMRQFAVHLQAAARGFLVRLRWHDNQADCTAAESEILRLQSLVRAKRARSEIQLLKLQTRNEEAGVKLFQAALRGALIRKQAYDQYEETRDAEQEVQCLQASIRGMMKRHALSRDVSTLKRVADKKIQFFQAAIRGVMTRLALSRDSSDLEKETETIIAIQAAVRGFAARKRIAADEKLLEDMTETWVALQSFARGFVLRNNLQNHRLQLRAQTPSITGLQAAIRGFTLRNILTSMALALAAEENGVTLLQGSIRSFLLRYRLDQDQNALLQQEPHICHLQALARAAIVRIDIGDFLAQLDESTDEIIQLQAMSRAMLLRIDVGSALADLEAEDEVITDLQSFIRGGLVRRKFAEKQRFYRENMDKVIKVQSFVRAKIQGEAYRSLTSGKNPPVGTIKGFVHLLNDSDFDFDEEIEFERLRKTVVQQVRQNEMADQYITQLDIKIALLVKNKITLDEVVRHQKHFGGHVGAVLPNVDISSKDPFDLKALNKTSRRKLEYYQELFFLLQTQPQYLARIFRRMREQATPERENERIKHLVMGLFGYAQKRREEYYLIKLLVRSIKEEADICASIQDYIRCNSFWNKLFVAYTKSPRDRKFMKDLLGQIVKENIVDNAELDLESDPIQIYRSAINNEELRTGQRSRRPPDVPREQAIKDPETRATFIRNLQDLRDIADQIFSSLEESLHRMPFGVRFLAKQMYEYLLSKFEGEDRGYLLQVTGQWIWKAYLQPAMMEPEKSGVVNHALTQEQKRSLGEISKVIAQVASGRLFGSDNVYLQPLNTYIGASIQRIGYIWGNLVTVQDAEAYFEIDEYNDLYAKTKPTLYIKMSDIFSIHQLVAAEISHICGHDDTLREIIRDLGSVKSNENELMSVSSSEISLTLTPKLHNVEDPDAEVKALFMETKRCILYIIRVQSGANLLEILVKPPTPEDERRWEKLVREEFSHNSQKRAAYSDANTLVDIGAMNYPELKRTALENIVRLEQAGRITRHNQYQDLLNEIALDIRTKHRRRIQRQRELEGVRLTLDRLNDQAVYLEQQLKTYNDYIEQAMVTLQNKKGKRRFLLPFTKQWDHERELQRSGRVFKFGSYKYSARNLADRGVLVHWKGYTERQWDRVDLTISSNEVGVFMIDGSSGNMMVPGANAQVPLDDLLQAQFNNTQFMDLFEGQLRVNVNLFLHLIMKKFYNE
ncbi:iqgap- protein [Emydomyces testavorans]|uniref:Iqgap- protein n=1 Tax=Emydomyces testavorans TaxID=2070801 RepID=A0AAF0DK80_9EURO|nr:iqgap- protein [Emydomyces testavorans]